MYVCMYVCMRVCACVCMCVYVCALALHTHTHNAQGAKSHEFTGMRAEFTGREWFECNRGKNNRRLYSWYGYHGGNMSWRQLLTLIVKVQYCRVGTPSPTHTHHHHHHLHAVQVHFPDERDMRFPSEKERQDKSRGVRLTNLEKCLLTKMFYTTGLTFTKLADLWGCCEHTVARAIEYWDPRWKQV